MRIEGHSFRASYNIIDKAFLRAPMVHTERWQGEDIAKRPEMKSYELLNFQLEVSLSGIEVLDFYRRDIQPNLPWADDHFAERVCGEPLNPPPSYKWWPWGGNAEKFTGPHGEFNHSYPERLWPKYAGMTDKGELGGTMFDPSYWDGYRSGECHPPRRGIRWEYGDLNDIVSLLVKEPLTRQAWIPLFFPEDTGIGDGGRKPCTLGYQFIVRNDRLHIWYPL